MSVKYSRDGDDYTDPVGPVESFPTSGPVISGTPLVVARRCADTIAALWSGISGPPYAVGYYQSGGWHTAYGSSQAPGRYLFRQWETVGKSGSSHTSKVRVGATESGAISSPPYDSNIEVASLASVRGGSVINLTWEHLSGAVGYDVEYSVNGGEWLRAASCSMAHSYHDDGLVGVSGGRADYTLRAVDPHAGYRFRVRASKSGSYGGWTEHSYKPASLPSVSNLRAFYNSAYDGRLAVSWAKVNGATGYHVTLWQKQPNHIENFLVRHHHTGHWLIPTDWMSTIQLCQGDWVRIGVRPVYSATGHWDGSGNGGLEIAGPWRNTPTYAINKHDPIGAPRGSKCSVPGNATGVVAGADNGTTGLTPKSGHAGNNSQKSDLVAKWKASAGGNARWFHVTYTCNNRSWGLMDHEDRQKLPAAVTRSGSGRYAVAGSVHTVSRNLAITHGWWSGSNDPNCRVGVRAGNERGWASWPGSGWVASIDGPPADP